MKNKKTNPYCLNNSGIVNHYYIVKANIGTIFDTSKNNSSQEATAVSIQTFEKLIQQNCLYIARQSILSKWFPAFFRKRFKLRPFGAAPFPRPELHHSNIPGSTGDPPKRITAAGLHDWLLLSYSIWIKLAYDLCLLFCLFAIIVPKILSNWLISIKKCYILLFLLIIRYSYRVLPLLTVHTVISTKRSAWRDLSTTLEMTTCWFIIAVWIADTQ